MLTAAHIQWIITQLNERPAFQGMNGSQMKLHAKSQIEVEMVLGSMFEALQNKNIAEAKKEASSGANGAAAKEDDAPPVNDEEAEAPPSNPL